MSFAETPLARTPDPRLATPPPEGGSPTRWVAVAALAIAAGAGLAFWWMTRAQPDQVPPGPTAATEGAVTSQRPQRQPMDLPTLDSSDVIFRDAVAVLSKNPMLTRLVATDGLIRNTALAVVQIGDGKTPAVPLKVLRPASRIAITGPDQGRIDPASYPRWNGAATALLSVRPTDAAQLYVNVKDLFDAAYAELGFPNGNFDDAIQRAVEMIVRTPQPVEPPELLRRPNFFEHTDPALRSLRPVQKQVILFGPENQARLTTWLRQLATALDLKVG
jgi:hypothetical protein